MKTQKRKELEMSMRILAIQHDLEDETLATIYLEKLTDKQLKEVILETIEFIES